MSINEILASLENDVRNQSYTSRGTRPVCQLSPKAKILIIGQAPGAKVEASGIPFADKSGETLKRWLGVDDQTFYDADKIAILPMDLYFPGKGKTGDLPPRKFVAEEYHPLLLAELKEVKLTILIGKYAIEHYLGDRVKKNATETIRAYSEYLPVYFPVVHPSPLNFRWQRKNPWFEAETVPALQRAVADILK